MTRRLTDLRLAAGTLVGAAVALLVPGVPWPIEWAFGLPLLVVLPGYAVVAALFPVTPEASPGDRGGTPGWAARLALSLASSAVVVAVVGVLLGAFGLLAVGPVVLLVTGVSLAGLGVVAGRRRGLTDRDRVEPGVDLPPAAVTSDVATSRTQTVVLGVATVALVGALVFAGGTVASDEPYSEVYLSVADDDGDLRPANGTVTFAAGTDNAVSLEIGNHEGVETEYGVVVLLQRVGADGTVNDQQRLDRFDASLEANETGSYERNLSPSMTGERLRLRTLVYKGGVPDGAGAAEADLTLRHWVTVTAEGSG